MQLTVLGATGSLGRECVSQALEAGHAVRVLARSPDKLEPALRERVQVVAGDALDADALARSLEGSDAVLFAIGVDAKSPPDLCTDVTRHLLRLMPERGVRRLVWCGGGSTLTERDRPGMGERFVAFFARTFMSLRHHDKTHQWELLQRHRDVEWVGIRPLQMREGPRLESYRLGYDRFSGFSKIHFADCAHAMLHMLRDDRWLHEAPVVQY